MCGSSLARCSISGMHRLDADLEIFALNSTWRRFLSTLISFFSFSANFFLRSAFRLLNPVRNSLQNSKHYIPYFNEGKSTDVTYAFLGLLSFLLIKYQIHFGLSILGIVNSSCVCDVWGHFNLSK